jgi:agmatinase
MEGMDGFAATRTGARGAPTFLGAPRASLEALTTPFAAIGAPFGVPYAIRNVHHGACDAPAALRAASARFGRMLEHHDFDLGGTPFDGQPWPIVDLGDVPADPRDLPGNAARVTKAVAAVVGRASRPLEDYHIKRQRTCSSGWPGAGGRSA